MTSADPASLADAARILRRLADDFAESTEALRPASRGAIRSGASAGTRADLRRITAACEATAAAVRDGGAALHHAAYAAADHAHARSALADDARAVGLAVADTPHESTPRLTLAPGIAGIADPDQVAARASVLVELTERRRSLAEEHRSQQAALRDRLSELTVTLADVARTLR